MEIRQITENKKQFLQLLLLADEQEDMIDRYLSRGELFALYDPFPPPSAGSVCGNPGGAGGV